MHNQWRVLSSKRSRPGFLNRGPRPPPLGAKHQSAIILIIRQLNLNLWFSLWRHRLPLWQVVVESCNSWLDSFSLGIFIDEQGHKPRKVDNHWAGRCIYDIKFGMLQVRKNGISQRQRSGGGVAQRQWSGGGVAHFAYPEGTLVLDMLLSRAWRLLNHPACHLLSNRRFFPNGDKNLTSAACAKKNTELTGSGLDQSLRRSVFDPRKPTWLRLLVTSSRRELISQLTADKSSDDHELSVAANDIVQSVIDDALRVVEKVYVELFFVKFRFFGNFLSVVLVSREIFTATLLLDSISRNCRLGNFFKNLIQHNWKAGGGTFASAALLSICENRLI